MWEWLKDGKNLLGLGTVAAGVGSIYGGIKSAEAADKMIALENDRFNLNKSLLLADEESKKRERAAYKRAYSAGGVAPIAS